MRQLHSFAVALLNNSILVVVTKMEFLQHLCNIFITKFNCTSIDGFLNFI